MHSWGGGWAARASCEAALRHHEHNAGVLRPLLHAPRLRVCLESADQVTSPGGPALSQLPHENDSQTARMKAHLLHLGLRLGTLRS